MAYILTVCLHVGLVSHVEDSNVVRQGLLSQVCSEVNWPHAVGIQRGECCFCLGFDPGPRAVVEVMEAEFHREYNESPGIPESPELLDYNFLLRGHGFLLNCCKAKLIESNIQMFCACVVLCEED